MNNNKNCISFIIIIIVVVIYCTKYQIQINAAEFFYSSNSPEQNRGYFWLNRILLFYNGYECSWYNQNLESFYNLYFELWACNL